MIKLTAHIIFTTILLIAFGAFAILFVLSIVNALVAQTIITAILASLTGISGMYFLASTLAWAKEIDNVLYALIMRSKEIDE